MRSAIVRPALMLLAIAGPEPLRPTGRMEHPALREVSGLVASRRHPGIFWAHNDSGNAPALFALRADGSLVREYAVAAPNLDWEDIAIDDLGHLYVGEIGNNGGRLPVRGVYTIDEPDPTAPDVGVLPLRSESYYRFPDSGRFDAEGLFLSGGRAIVVSKRSDRGEAELWAAPLEPPAPIFRPAMPERLGTLPGFVEGVTGADLSADGRYLAATGYAVLRVYERDERGAWLPIAGLRFQADGVEAIAWDGGDLILASEERSLYRIAEASWRAGRLP